FVSYFRSRRWNRGGETSSGSKGAELGLRGLQEENTRSDGKIPDRVFIVFGTREKQKGARAKALNPRPGIFAFSGTVRFTIPGRTIKYPTGYFDRVSRPGG
ncbi:unnamed protein product, partial [Linum tenue]